MNDDPHEKVREKWRNQLGNFMMDFGEIEYISYSLWEKTHNSGLPPHNFTKRTRQVISQLNSNKDESIISLLQNAIKLAKKRNTIVHNPMHLQVFRHNVTKELYPEFAIMSFVGNDYVDLPDLTELTAEITDTMTQLYMTLGYLPLEDKVANK